VASLSCKTHSFFFKVVVYKVNAFGWQSADAAHHNRRWHQQSDTIGRSLLHRLAAKAGDRPGLIPTEVISIQIG
jgi:hypothetical protein